MAFGFIPKHVQDYKLDNLSKADFLVLANDTLTKLNWKLSYISNNGLIAYTINTNFKFNAELTIKINGNNVSIKSASEGNEFFDWGKNKKVVESFISTLEDLKLNKTQDELKTSFYVLETIFTPENEDILKLPPQTTQEKVKDFFSLFVPTQNYFVTPILLGITILVFSVMILTGVGIMSPETEDLIKWGANYKPATLDGQWWRLITSCFLHIGIIHLALNMYALIYIGVLLEPLLGKARFFTAYILTGITGSITSLWWHDVTVSAGASGAIFGMYGVFLAMLTTNYIEKTQRKELLASIAMFVGYNLLFGLSGGIDNAAHIGGLVGGIIIGYSIIPSLKNYTNIKLKYTTLTTLICVIVFSSFMIYKNTPNNIGIYEAKLKKFTELESIALSIYSLPDNESNDKILHSIKEDGLVNWKKNIEILKSIDSLKLPKHFVARNLLLKQYCELRIKSYELLYKAVNENTENYKNEIENYNKLIEAKVKELERN